MTVELRGLDFIRKRALLLASGRWYSSSDEHDWRPVPLGLDEGVATLAGPDLILVRHEFATFTDLIKVVQEILSKGSATTETVRYRLEEIRCQAENRKSAWSRDFPNLIQAFHEFLDKLFCRWGCSQETSFRLSLEVFDRLHKVGPFEDVPLTLADLAHMVFLERPDEERRVGFSEPEGKSGERQEAPLHPSEKEEDWPFRLALQGFDRPTLQCLHLWADSGYDEAAVAKILKFPVDKVGIWFALIEAKLGRSRQELRDPALRDAVKRRLTIKSAKQSAAKRVS